MKKGLDAFHLIGDEIKDSDSRKQFVKKLRSAQSFYNNSFDSYSKTISKNPKGIEVQMKQDKKFQEFKVALKGLQEETFKYLKNNRHVPNSDTQEQLLGHLMAVNIFQGTVFKQG